MASQAYNDGPNNSYTVVSPGALTATNIACATLTTSGLTTATAGAVVGTYVTSSPARNPYIEIKHATTDHPLASYLVCRNSAGNSIGGIDQETSTSIRFTAGVVTATAGVIVGTTADSTPAVNPSVIIYHAGTDNALCLCAVPELGWGQYRGY